MNLREMLAAFDAWRVAGEDLVLATVYDTSGSTYSKAGAQMLIDPGGRFRGMLSGGCLEGDLAERAAATLASGRPDAVTYDLGSSDEELWGLGVGCDGVMRIFLQPLAAAADHAPFAAMADVYRGDAAGAAATVVASGHDALLPGTTVVRDGSGQLVAGGDAGLAELAAAGLADVAATRENRLQTLVVSDRPVELLFACLAPPPRILVLGAGLDAEPVVRLLAELGWRVTVQDHRPAYVARGDFPGAERVLSVPAADVGREIDLDRHDAAIIMSHHLQTDRTYLATLADTRIGYIGLLGPVARRRRLQKDLGENADRLAGRVHGPAGLDLGGRGPAAIALSIVAELHRQLLGRSQG